MIGREHCSCWERCRRRRLSKSENVACRCDLDSFVPSNKVCRKETNQDKENRLAEHTVSEVRNNIRKVREFEVTLCNGNRRDQSFSDFLRFTGKWFCHPQEECGHIMHFQVPNVMWSGGIGRNVPVSTNIILHRELNTCHQLPVCTLPKNKLHSRIETCCTRVGITSRGRLA